MSAKIAAAFISDLAKCAYSRDSLEVSVSDNTPSELTPPVDAACRTDGAQNLFEESNSDSVVSSVHVLHLTKLIRS